MFQVLNLCFVKHWILNWQSFTENQEERTTWPPPPRQCQRCKFVILFKSSLHPYLSLHGKPFFFFQTSWKYGLSKKNALEFDLSCIIGKYDIYFSRKYDLTPRRKMKDDLSQKNTRKYGIFFKCSEKMVFSKRTEPGHDLSCTSWKGGIFFQKTCFFFPCTENERGMTFPGKYTETWYFLFDMFHTPLRRKKSKTTLCCKNTPKGDWHSRSTPKKELQELPVASWRPLQAFSYIAVQQQQQEQET